MVMQSLAEQELSSRSGELPWLEGSSVKRLPGPIAFEYSSFKGLMLDGKIEASCWKITNLCEVIVSYLFAACIEENPSVYQEVYHGKRRVTFVSDKIDIVINFYHLYKLFRNIRTIMDWRNKYGVGHGSLTLSKEAYIDVLIRFSGDLLSSFNQLMNLLHEHGLSLYDSCGTTLVGEDYFNLLRKNDGNVTLSTKADFPIANSLNNPIRFFGYQFDIPDTYFLVAKFSRNRTLMYRNYSNNRAKYIDNQGIIVWNEEPEQVALLNKDERQAWFTYLQNHNSRPDLLIKGAEGFQALGMHQETQECLNVFDSLQTSSTDLTKKAQLIKYSHYTALGIYDDANQALEQTKAILRHSPDPLFETRVKLVHSWYEAKIGNTAPATIICDEGIKIARELRDKLPLTAYIRELDIRKNKMYAQRVIAEDSEALRLECLQLIEEALKVYEEISDNRTIIDIIGFSCNLYGDYSTKSIKRGVVGEAQVKAEKEQIINIVDKGINIRKKALEKHPTDLWAVRGYAWSLHSKARRLMEINEDYKSAEMLLNEALDIRNKERERRDLGLFEDLVKNYIELFIAEGRPDGLVDERSKKIEKLMDYLNEKEGYSPRMQYMQGEVLKNGLRCRDYSKWRRNDLEE